CCDQRSLRRCSSSALKKRWWIVEQALRLRGNRSGCHTICCRQALLSQLRRSFCYSRGSTPIKGETKRKKSHKFHPRPKQDRFCLPSQVEAASRDRWPPTNSFPLVLPRSSITLATKACSLPTIRSNR